MLGVDTDRLLEAGVTGLNTRAGDVITITFKKTYASSHSRRRT